MQQIARAFILAFNDRPRAQRIILGSLTIVTLVVAIWRPALYALLVPQFTNCLFLLKDQRPHTLVPEANRIVDQIPPERDADIPEDADEISIEGEKKVHRYIISTGDDISRVLSQYRITLTDATMLSQKNLVLYSLKINQPFFWRMTSQGYFRRLTWHVSRRKTRTHEHINGNFKKSITYITDESRAALLTGQLNGGFVTSARLTGLTAGDINSMIKALQWQIDFRKLSKGDQFSVLSSREPLKGTASSGQLYGMRLHTKGKDYYAFLADNGQFYNNEATGLTRGFIRLPTLKTFRVSSHFNPRRLHPITGRISAHHGVDFAMPVGTSVLAVSDGEVIVSKRNSASGNYVEIRHGRQCMTRYMHLHTLFVKQGQKVNRGECIALSGNTGRSTGPHLHYEFWLYQRAVDPLTAKLPRTEWLTGRDHDKYRTQVKQLFPKLQLN
ncbi:murein DD-endopeptidase MepM [secondary endosymbiont of Ctenarytaina eucalypti]|uniref:Metalloendopeptidase-like membrane protein n=1 Tax=secondary endosymbiont of Ctenarytaina eucalypti TaxID=1199245 RepID=J3VSL4_9ENTR|nr:murein DD-endopeptidase MepM [secondary endosymbiont of Ctenarytaina eucalypti]AFP84926.1 metalloendopeptidase-like membrane protein [secondary endosymbiont of Ctenarytaina eucalypti]